MPKGKKKSKAGAGLPRIKLEPSLLAGSEDESNIDNASVLSLASDSRCGSDEGTVGDPDVEDSSVFDDFEDKIKEAIDGTMQKSAKSRQACLESIRKALTSRYLYEFVSDMKVTLGDMLERSLKRGKGDEQSAAAILAVIVSIHFGAGSKSEALFHDFAPILVSILHDPSASSAVRAKCATSLGLCCFIAGAGLEVTSTMEALRSVFSDSYLKGNGAIPTHSPETAALHGSCLLAWSLLLTIPSSIHIIDMAEIHLKRLPELLQSSDLDLRIAAGEAVAILYELARAYDDTFEGCGIDDLCDTLRELATDSQKFRAKKDRRQQRSSFRDILRAIEDKEGPDITVKFGREVLEIDTWCRKRQYDAFCQVLGSGMNLHLSVNELLRDIFGLGAPLSNGGLIPKISKFERHMVNVATCKARTKTRNRQRDKRADVIC